MQAPQLMHSSLSTQGVFAITFLPSILDGSCGQVVAALLWDQQGRFTVATLRKEQEVFEVTSQSCRRLCFFNIQKLTILYIYLHQFRTDHG